ncbi:LytTR family DNA-binding domain-containing protein [Polaribacter sp. Z022]|uniref:LytR/AlgR family response regulator transcription factor n=1 Tax=Polaribacter sp. Z022 TaxID=2927125 RepID=UPI0020217994|nr:LytTR family DNA-binding domain-containing protein [Polaribacter sp. Z022]MCL7753299.1 LytTR family DNA-binding domain-containing protein [Polaribacter sp. Z022]
MPEKIKALIVEDDAVSIRLLTLLLNKYCEEIEIIGEAKNSIEFIDRLLALKPDLLFLDIDIGEKRNTLEILHEIGEIDCEIIITSSHKDYAIKAINEYHVSSYIVKPISTIKLKKAVETVIKNLQYKKAFSERLQNIEPLDSIIALPNLNSVNLVDAKDVLYLEADGKYTVFHLVKDTSIVVSKNIGHYETYLPKHLFFRIHHKYIVNLKKVISIQRTDGDYCMLKNGKSLSIAKRRIDNLRKFLHLK